MSRKNLLLAFLGLILIALLVWAFQDMNGFSWRETYKTDSKEPYGLFVTHDLLKQYTSASDLIELKDSLSGQFPENIYEKGVSNYLYIGEGLFMRPQDRDALLDFVQEGNIALISAKVLPFDLMFYLYYTECNYEPWDGLVQLNDSTIRLNFEHADLRQANDFEFTFLIKHAPTITTWNYFPDSYFCDTEDGLLPIGKANNETINMVQIPYGDGYFYLHSMPQVFTNLFMVQEDGRRYAEKTLSHLNDGPIYWDEYSRIPEYLARNMNQQPTANHLNSQNPLQYIQEQPPLAWAWYILMGIGLVFMLFRTKRKQRIIPVQQEKKNTSLQFLQTIGWLSYQKSGHQQLAKQAIKLFRSHIKERYGLAWRNDDPFFIQQLSNRSGVDEEQIMAIAKDIKNIPLYTGLVGTELVKFHQRLEHFYQTAK